jgi:FlaA1/EpsC-like NDP-sugar epimerase
MPLRHVKRPALIILFIASVLLLNFPLIALAESVIEAGRFPLLLFYLLIIWIGIVRLIARLYAGGKKREQNE